MKIKAKQFSLNEALVPTHNAVDLGNTSSPLQTVYSSDFAGNLTGAVRFKAKNETGSTINKGSAVYINGVSGDVPTVALADADVSASMPAVGLTEASANNNAEVHIISFGNLTGLDTSTLGTVGQSVFIHTTAGALTTTKPTGTSSKLQNIGQIIRQHATEGIIKVGGAGRTAATPNLDEGHFFLGNASNQSVESAYQLPIAIGTSGHVLTSDGTNVTFQAASGGDSASRPTVTEITSTPYTVSNPSASVLEEIYVCDTGASVITLPTAVGNEGLKIQVKNRISSAITVNAPNPGTQQTIDGSNSISITSQYESLTFVSDNTNWNII